MFHCHCEKSAPIGAVIRSERRRIRQGLSHYDQFPSLFLQLRQLNGATDEEEPKNLIKTALNDWNLRARGVNVAIIILGRRRCRCRWDRDGDGRMLPL